MNIINATSSAVIDYIKPHLCAEVPTYQEQTAEIIRELLTSQPDKTLVLTIFDNDILKGFVVAYAPDGAEHVLLIDTWMDNDLPGSLWQDKVFLRLCIWADGLGRKKINAETNRNPRALLKRWNFKLLTKIVSFDLENFEERLLSGDGHKNLIGTEESAQKEESTPEKEQPDNVPNTLSEKENEE